MDKEKECAYKRMYNGVYTSEKRKETEEEIERSRKEKKNVLSEEQFLKNNLEFFRVIRFF